MVTDALPPNQRDKVEHRIERGLQKWCLAMC